MHSNDDFMPQRRELSDLMADRGPSGPVGGIESLMVESASQSHPYFGLPVSDPYAGDVSPWPPYDPYEPELPAAERYQRLAPPPPAYAPEPEPEPVRYEDGRMTHELFDWSMRNLPEPPTPFDELI
ncbi:MAG: hypothetical protein J5J06_15800 [Phycisphaerae bacterium]|nr:hypothetical protein [Phycisphaerae bacterium]